MVRRGPALGGEGLSLVATSPPATCIHAGDFPWKAGSALAPGDDASAEDGNGSTATQCFLAKEYRVLQAQVERGREERAILKEEAAHLDRYCVYRIAAINDAIVQHELQLLARHQEPAPEVEPASQAGPESSSMSGGVSSARMSAGKVFLLQCMCNKLQLMLDDARARAAGRQPCGSDKD